MGWYESVKTGMLNAWNNQSFKNTALTGYQTTKTTLINFWNNQSFKKSAKATGTLAGNVFINTAHQAKAVPSAIWASLSAIHSGSSTVLNSGRMVLEDSLPLLLVSQHVGKNLGWDEENITKITTIALAYLIIESGYNIIKYRNNAYRLLRIGLDTTPLLVVGHQLLKQHLCEDDNEPVEENHLLNFLIMNLWDTRKQISEMIHLALLDLQASSESKLNDNNDAEICIQEKCSQGQHIKGSFKKLVSFNITRASIMAIYYIPGIGDLFIVKLAVGALLVIHNGRYILSTVTDKMCAEHQSRYLQQEQGMAISLGITHLVSSQATISYLHDLTGASSSIYQPVIERLLKDILVLVAAQMEHPAYDAKKTGTIINVVEEYHKGVEIGFDIVVEGGIVVIPKLLKNKGPGIDWRKLVGYAEYAWDTRLRRALHFVLLPQFLQDTDSFYSDPIISQNIEGALRPIITIINLLNSHRHEWYARWTERALGKNKTAFGLELILGTPRQLNKLILIIARNNDIMEQLVRLAVFLDKILNRSQALVIREESTSLRYENAPPLDPAPVVVPTREPQGFRLINEDNAKSKEEHHRTNMKIISSDSANKPTRRKKAGDIRILASDNNESFFNSRAAKATSSAKVANLRPRIQTFEEEPARGMSQS